MDRPLWRSFLCSPQRYWYFLYIYLTTRLRLLVVRRSKLKTTQSMPVNITSTNIIRQFRNCLRLISARSNAFVNDMFFAKEPKANNMNKHYSFPSRSSKARKHPQSESLVLRLLQPRSRDFESSRHGSNAPFLGNIGTSTRQTHGTSSRQKLSRRNGRQTSL